MAERQPFRFRLPWLTTPATPRTTPVAETQAPPPAAETQAPTQPTATVPIQRPPFRPAGIAPVQAPPPPPITPPRTQPRSPPQPPTTTEPRATSRPTSPARAPTQPGAASLPSSPSLQSRSSSLPRTPPQTASQPQSSQQTTSQTQSPPRLASQPVDQTPSQPPSSPPRMAAPVQQVAKVVSQPPSPPMKLQPTSEVSSQPPPPIPSQPAPSNAQQEEESKHALAQPESQKPQSKTEIKPDEKTTEPSQILESSLPVPDVKEQRKEEELNQPIHEEPNLITVSVPHTEAPGPETQTKEQLNVASKEEKEPEKQEIRVKETPKKALGFSGGMFKTGNSTQHPKDRNHKPAFLNGERVALHKEIKEDISQFVHKLGNGPLKQTAIDKPISVMTLAGENRGASMQLSSEQARKEGSVHIRRGYKTNPDESVDATTDAEGSSKGRTSKDSMTIKEHQASKAFINSNVQSINNSILSNSSVAERNPGVKLAISHSPTESINAYGKTESFETHKSEVTITPAEKFTHQPRVRRRCLRGLFLEPSDSDPDNPDKPRRHGCRYGCREEGCREEGKDKEIGVL